MTPIFGQGVVFDASPERRKEMLHNSALRGEQMKGHAATIENEVKKIIADWGDEGEIELLDFFSELTIYNLNGLPDRAEVPRAVGLQVRAVLPRTGARYRSAVLRRPLSGHRELPGARRVPRETRCAGSGDHGRSHRQPPKGQGRPRPARHPRVGKDEDGKPRFSADEVTGMFISLMFAGTTPVRALRRGRSSS